MKDFALQLKGCSKSDRKKCEDLAISVGRGFGDYDRFNSGWRYLTFKDRMYYCHRTNEDRTIYQMPQDWELIKAALGVDVIPEYVECLDVLVENTFLGNISKTIGHTDSYYKISGGEFIPKRKCKPSTKEAYENQEAKKNVSFSADDVLKVSDAFRIESGKLRGRLSKKSDRIKDLEKENELFKCRIKELTEQCDEIYANNKPNVVINELEEINNAQRRKEIELRGKIGMLEESRVTIVKKFVTSNNELNVEIETKDKRIAELEGNLILVGDLISKTLS